MASAKPKAEINLASVIAACIERAGGRNTQASELLAGLAAEDDDLYDLIMEGQLESRCYVLVGEAIRKTNAHIRSKHQDNVVSLQAPRTPAAQTVSASTVASVAERKGRYSERLSDMLIFGMGRLCDLTGSQVTAAAGRYADLENANSLQRRFCTQIARLVRPDQVVGQVLNETRLQRIYFEVQAAA